MTIYRLLKTSKQYLIASLFLAFGLMVLGYGFVEAWNPIGATWASNSIPYDDSTLPYLWQQDINYSRQRWNNVYPSPFNFYRDTSSNNDVKYGNLPANVTGDTNLTTSGSTITRIIIQFNVNKSWHNGWSAPPSNKYDARHTAAHEFGHALGLDHSNECPSNYWQWATMCNGTWAGAYFKRSLEADDRSGINSLYP